MTDPEGKDPAIDKQWLELPSGINGDRYIINTMYSSGERNYTHLYDKDTYLSLWTAYPLKSSHMGSLDRPSSWSYNPNIDSQYQADLRSKSYDTGDNGLSYSRGHMIPNASRNGISEMQKQTFHVTNSVPQRQDKFNGTIWAKLETAVRAEASSEEIYVVTGVAFRKKGGSETIKYIKPQHDTKQCPVPNYFYKVVMKVKRSGGTITSASTVGFWFEHKKYSGSYADHTVSVDQIEQWTGMNFFVNLPDSVEASAETNANWSSFQSF